MNRAVPLLALLALNACAMPPPSTDPAVGTVSGASSGTTSVAGFVSDDKRPAFDAFIATQPNPEQFRARYPDVTLVLPGTIASKEFRMNNSRYFAQLDAAGRITSGKFQ
jgi:hypothetical protein